jgi:hypothetical protein
MRSLFLVVAACCVSTLARAQTSSSAPVCPPPDSIRSAGYATAAVTSADGRSTVRIRDGGGSRYMTYVVDSQYVVTVDGRALASPNGTLLDGLSADDIAEIVVIKETDSPPQEWRAWHSCPGVPIALIQTKSKTWRPRTPEPRKPD